MEETISERLVAYIWQHQFVTTLVTDKGEEVRVIFPGRTCSNGGSDFCDAVFILGGKLVKGDIEIHVRSSQWYRHGHHQDSNYNTVALHVVMWADCTTGTVLQNGNSIPTVCLGAFFNHPLHSGNRRISLSYRCTPSCQHLRNHFKNESLSEVLLAAGEERFASKVKLFQRSFMTENAGQVLFKNIARALGYEKNTVPCEKLSDMLPLQFLEEKGNDVGGAIFQALLFGTSGLLPFQRLEGKRTLAEEAEVAEWELIWRSSNIDRALNYSDWHFFRVRPANSPVRRLAALSYLLNKCRRSGLLRYTLNLVEDSSGNNAHQFIQNGLLIPGQGYWANHIDFGVISARDLVLLGRSKAAEIVVNVILPFAYAWGILYAAHDLKEKAMRVYLNYPQLDDNQLVRFMKQQLLLRPDVNLSASQQQGLLHIYKNYCRYRNCEACPVTINQS